MQWKWKRQLIRLRFGWMLLLRWELWRRLLSDQLTSELFSCDLTGGSIMFVWSAAKLLTRFDLKTSFLPGWDAKSVMSESISGSVTFGIWCFVVVLLQWCGRNMMLSGSATTHCWIQKTRRLEEEDENTNAENTDQDIWRNISAVLIGIRVFHSLLFKIFHSPFIMVEMLIFSCPHNTSLHVEFIKKTSFEKSLQVSKPSTDEILHFHMKRVRLGAISLFLIPRWRSALIGAPITPFSDDLTTCKMQKMSL